MILQENSQCLVKAPNKAFSLMRVPTITSAFTIKYLLRHYAKLACKHGIKTFIGIFNQKDNNHLAAGSFRDLYKQNSPTVMK